MEKRFKKEGLKIHLVDILETGDPNLKVACIFDGQDADPHAERFKFYQDIVSVTSYLPSADIDMTCYKAVHICQCACVPEAVRSEHSHQLVST